MDKELKELKMIACRCCPYGPDTTKACNARYCEIKKVMDAYKNVKKDLIGRQKKIASLTVENAGALAMRDHYEEHYVVECAKNRNLYAKYISVVRENAQLKLANDKKEE